MTFAARYIGWIKSSLYQIQRSVRTRRSASGYLSRTPASSGNRKTWTWSAWVKRGDVGAVSQYLFSGGTGGTDTTQNGFNFQTNGTLRFAGGSSVYHESVAVFRDPSAHMHIVLVFDTTNVTAADRLKMFVNGDRLAVNITNNPGLNTDYGINLGSNTHRVADWSSGGSSFDGYLSDVYFIDGQALTPSSFGQINAITGQWSAKQYVGTYGTNGFYLDFSDNSSLANLCLDRSGNNNHFTANNISLTAGATYDSMLDVPLGGGGNERGNYCTWSPVDSAVSKPTNGNLRAGTNAGEANRGSIFHSAGKWYFEFQFDVITSGAAIGIGKSAAARSEYPGFDASGYGYNPNTGNKNNAGVGAAYGAAFGTSDIIGVAYDLDNGKIWWSKNGVWQVAGDPVAGTNAAYTGLSGEFAPMYGVSSGGAGNGGHANFGQRPFAYTPPAGFKALHTGNLVSETVAVSGPFTGNASADGPAVWMNGSPETLTINGNAVTFGIHADKTAGGFKLRTSSSSYNVSGTNTWTATVLSPSTKSAFKHQNAKGNP